MTASRLLIGLVLVATVLVDLVAWSLANRADFRVPSALPLVHVIFAALGSGQVGLVAVWASWGRSSLPWRLLATVLTVVVWSHWIGLGLPLPPGAKGDDYPSALRTQVAVVLLTQSLAIVAILGFVQSAGVRLMHIDEIPVLKRPGTTPPTWQFSLGDLLAWLTSLAMILSSLRSTLDAQWLSPVWAGWPRIAGTAFLRVAGTLFLLWMLLGTNRPVLGSLLVAGFVLGSVVGVPSLTSFPPPNCLLVIQSVPLLWMGLSLGVVRVAGYRLGWKVER